VRTRGQAAIWVALNFVGSLCTPTLIRPDNEREGWVMSHKLTWVAATSTAARRQLAAAAVHREE
jgi:hypothetical protein